MVKTSRTEERQEERSAVGLTDPGKNSTGRNSSDGWIGQKGSRRIAQFRWSWATLTLLGKLVSKFLSCSHTGIDMQRGMNGFKTITKILLAKINLFIRFYPLLHKETQMYFLGPSKCVHIFLVASSLADIAFWMKATYGCLCYFYRKTFLTNCIFSNVYFWIGSNSKNRRKIPREIFIVDLFNSWFSKPPTEVHQLTHVIDLLSLLTN